MIAVVLFPPFHSRRRHVSGIQPREPAFLNRSAGRRQVFQSPPSLLQLSLTPPSFLVLSLFKERVVPRDGAISSSLVCGFLYCCFPCSQSLWGSFRGSILLIKRTLLIVSGSTRFFDREGELSRIRLLVPFPPQFSSNRASLPSTSLALAFTVKDCFASSRVSPM